MKSGSVAVISAPEFFFLLLPVAGFAGALLNIIHLFSTTYKT
jgi:hypothetical protein